MVATRMWDNWEDLLDEVVRHGDDSREKVERGYFHLLL